MSEENENRDHREHGGHGGHHQGGWQPIPRGEYESDATAFVQLPPDFELDAAPLAAPGHGYVPPQIPAPVTPGAATDPGATGTWVVQWPEAPDSAGAPVPPAPEPAHDPHATAEWRFPDPSQMTGQWSIPLAGGDLPDESGEFTTSALMDQWAQQQPAPWGADTSTAPPTLPGGARAPWAQEHAYGTAEPEPYAREEDVAPAGGALAADAFAEDPSGHEVPVVDAARTEGVAPETGLHARVEPAREPEGGAEEAFAPEPGAVFVPGQGGPGEDERVPDAGGAVTGPDPVVPEGAVVPEGSAPSEDAVVPEEPVVEAAPPEDPSAVASATSATSVASAPFVADEDPEGQPHEPAGPFTGADGVRPPHSAEPFAAGPVGPPAAPPVAAEPVEASADAPQEAEDGPHAPVAVPVPVPEPQGAPDDAPGAEDIPHAVADPAPGPARVPADEHPHTSYVLRVNGADRPVTGAWIGESLLYVLRERLGLAGAKDGCSQGECGACNVQVDGRLVASCLVPAATAAGSEVRTVEGLAADGEPSDVQRALARCGAVQCGFCVPGMAMTVHDLLEGNHDPSDLETRQALCGNLCRCSGYRGVLEAVREVVAERASGTAAEGGADQARVPHQVPHPHDGGMA
ncbi:2Fe-2S iron-sulfur cluster-binding protein [Streptomyces sp. NPDC001941]|uniref:(2Fe-2S)-binding protein n=1 Tax=Streptomyces sp. NPDC001941 TaxID=3154659 RepID=UPI00332FE51C